MMKVVSNRDAVEKICFLLCLFNGFYGLSFLAHFTLEVDNVKKPIKKIIFIFFSSTAHKHLCVRIALLRISQETHVKVLIKSSSTSCYPGFFNVQCFYDDSLIDR